MMGKKGCKILFVILTVLMLISVVPMTAGAGTADSDYIPIYTKEDLNNVRNNLNGNYILMNDIVFTDADFEAGGDFYNDGMGWLPIGGVFTKWSADYNEFKGVFNGNGYSIKNLKMNRTPTVYTAYPQKTVYLPDGTKMTLNAYHSFGLFASNAGTIKNLNVCVDFSINANPYAVAGGICGINSGLISNCKASGELFIEKTSDSGDSYLGGIAGLIDGGTITFCSNEANLYGKNTYFFPYINCGGIIGGSTGLATNVVSYCYNIGNITPETESDGYLGGIAARASNGSYYDGFSLTIENCYNTGTIGSETTSGKIAGICGEGYHEDTKIINCYNVGTILASGKTAGIVFEENRSTDCYYLNTSADSLWCSYWGSTLYVINALQDVQMKTEEAFVGFDFENVWIIDAKSEYPYPQLRNNRQSKGLAESHNYTEEIIRQASCTQNGVKTLTCTDCGVVLEVEIEAKGHTYDKIIVTAPTCSEEGFTTYFCDCGESYTADFVAENSTNHTGETEIRDAIKETCVKNGYTGDTYCLSCNTRIETGTIIPATGIHNHTSEITTPATHLTDGVETFTCECGDTYTNPVAKLPGHIYETEVTDPTCTEQGYTTYTCACSDSYVADYVGASGHSYTSEITTPATHLTDGVETFTCECGDTYTNPVAKLPGHMYEKTVTVPTCTAQGCTIYTCACGDTYVSDYVTMLAHKYDNACDMLCNVCFASRPISHSYETTTTKATLTTNGSIKTVCTLCGDVKSDTTISYPKTFTLSATTLTYNAYVRTPTVTVKDAAGKVLTKDTDYTVTYAEGRKNIGTYNVTVTMKGNYTGTKTLSFKINPMDISKCTVKLSATSVTYNGNVRTPTVTVTNSNGAKLTKDTHYTVSYSSGRKNVGTYNVTVTLKGNYTGTKTLSFKINPMDISDCTVKLSATSYTYNAYVKTPTVTITNPNGAKLTKDTHYTVSYSSGRKNVGTYNVTVTLTGNYTGTKTLSFKITPMDISDCTVKLSATSYTYNAYVRTSTVTITNPNGAKLTKDTHYTVSYSSGRKNVGTYNVTVTLTGNYTGTKTLSFKITPMDISDCTVKLSATSYTYNAYTRTPSVTVKNSNGATLTKGTHYTVTYDAGRRNVGTYNVKVTLKGNYTGTKTLSFKIAPMDISDCTVKLSYISYTYNGSVKTPTVTVTNPNGAKLTKDTHYTVSYASGRKNVGTYKVTVTLKGNYTGKKTLTFKINPPKTTVASLTAGTKSITVNLTKKTTQVTGYQIQYSTNKDFTDAKTKTITSNSTVKTTLSSLSSGKTYYVRVRTYKTVNDVKYYSGWSAYKYVKTK